MQVGFQECDQIIGKSYVKLTFAFPILNFSRAFLRSERGSKDYNDRSKLPRDEFIH